MSPACNVNPISHRILLACRRVSAACLQAMIATSARVVSHGASQAPRRRIQTLHIFKNIFCEQPDFFNRDMTSLPGDIP